MILIVISRLLFLDQTWFHSVSSSSSSLTISSSFGFQTLREATLQATPVFGRKIPHPRLWIRIFNPPLLTKKHKPVHVFPCPSASNDLKDSALPLNRLRVCDLGRVHVCRLVTTTLCNHTSALLLHEKAAEPRPAIGPGRGCVNICRQAGGVERRGHRVRPGPAPSPARSPSWE